MRPLNGSGLQIESEDRIEVVIGCHAGKLVLRVTVRRDDAGGDGGRNRVVVAGRDVERLARLVDHRRATPDGVSAVTRGCHVRLPDDRPGIGVQGEHAPPETAALVARDERRKPLLV